MKKAKQLFRYIHYFFFSKNEHGIHSPFVFDLYTNIIKNKNSYYIYGPIESLRARMLISNIVISFEDLGTRQSKNKKVSKIAKNALKKPKYSQLLFRLLNYFECKNILEVGTSLGITTCYLAAVNKNTKVITLEGCKNTSAIAKSNFKRLNLSNIDLRIGNFNKTLKLATTHLQTIDFAFFDGNHKYEPTIDYFNHCLEHITESSIFVFDDIHWSTEMESAWTYIKGHPKVTCTIDLYEVGLVFFRKEIKKSDFVLFL